MRCPALSLALAGLMSIEVLHAVAHNIQPVDHVHFEFETKAERGPETVAASTATVRPKTQNLFFDLLCEL
jgi:hypothetical protein